MNPTETPTQPAPAPPAATEPPQPAPEPPAVSPAPAAPAAPATPPNQPATAAGKKKMWMYAVVGVVVLLAVIYFMFIKS
jgi:hypothetical protein